MYLTLTQTDPNVKQSLSQTEELQEDNVVQTLNFTIAAINITKDIVPIDLAKGILGTITNILNIVQSAIENKSDFLEIANKCDAITRVLARATDGATNDDLRGTLGDALSELNVSVNRIYSEVASMKELKWWQRLFSVMIDRDQISGWEKDLDRTLVLFNTEAITGTAIRMKELALGLNDNTDVSVNALKFRPTAPPSRPSMFYGRNALMAELTNLVLNDEHIALIGPGGTGKSSLSKAILNEPPITEKFGDRRFFVTYDGLDPSTMTFETFMTHLAEALGAVVAGSETMHQISVFLRSASALVVLDNAEAFEEASGSPGLQKIPPAITEIANIPGVILILMSRNRRNVPDVAWLTKDVPPLDLNSAQAVFFRIYGGASHSHAEEEIKCLLEALEFHPLSITILANAAQQNNWSPAMLLKRWNDRRSKLLDCGKGKLQSLSFTMQLSLSSPSIQDLGENGFRALTVIAFLPQGLNDDLARDLLPSIPQVDTICDVLCTQSFVYRQGGFVKMLAPIRHYVRDSLPPPDLICLRDIRALYYGAVKRCSLQRDNLADVIISDHLNIEHMVVFDLTCVPNGTEEACVMCWKFLRCLRTHLPRPTILTPLIFDIIEDSSTWKLKAHCLFSLGSLCNSLAQITGSMQAFEAAEALCISAGNHEEMAQCVVRRADNYRSQGHFTQSQNVLENLRRSDSWEGLTNSIQATIWFLLDLARMHTFTTSADELFTKSMNDRNWGIRSKIWHWHAKLYHGGDIAQVKMHLEDLLQCTSAGNYYENQHALRVLAEVAYREGRLSESMDILSTIVELVEGKDPQNVFWITIWRAVIASDQGNYDLARELIHKSSGPIESLTLSNARSFLHITYNAGQVELAAGQYHRAESYFASTIEGCDMQGDVRIKTFSLRGLGEVAFAQGNLNLAAQRFAETQSLCTETGVPPRNLYSCAPFCARQERFEGWMLFLEGQLPFANDRVM
ncbi:hypothetical protein K503DRAFT_227290 [Rhizopogon vinicolor AM-OR11-026]|uniref:ORC1/DEAH AAA+ ATPase domain-containing protein n=1 Tax=Rhizopogon vinicolor AM-OR11-026 TaxID=1314800 RepID=A0A1B7MY58_9AGAM|nr:hypothetical protein K503DRAFT_227290 [Rhizopogon vinicolor AM-OR11-026]